MGLLGAIGSGLAEAGGAGAKIGMEQIRAAIEADRDARLNEMRSNADLQTRARNKADAAEERGRVATEAGKIAEQRGGLISANAGLDDANYRGDEGIGVNVQKGQQTPGARDFLAAQGDYRSVANLEEKDADNRRQAERDKTSKEISDRDFGLREKQLAQGSQLAAIQVKTAQLAYDRAVEEKKIPVSVAKSFDAAKAQYHDLLTISSKADFDPASETGKRVLSEQAAVSKRMADLMTPYLPEGMKAEKPEAGGPPPVAERVVGKVYASPRGDVEWTGSGWKPAAAAKPAAAQPEPAKARAPASAEPEIVSLEPAGKTAFGSKQFVAKYADGTTKLISGADAERKAILMSK